MNLQRDPVTQSVISAEEQERDKRNWEARTTEFVRHCNPGDALALCQALYQFLDGESRGQLGRRPTMPLCDHAPDSYLADHALLTSAVVYCLGHDHRDIHLLRLAALSHELPADAQHALLAKINRNDDVIRSFLNDVWPRLRVQGERLAAALATENSLARFADEQPENQDEHHKLLWQAHLAAAARLHNTQFHDADGNRVKTIASSTDFAQHPLQRYSGSVGLVYGGVTKVKQYVFESARLPEIRGASVLLDRINQVDLPALWGWLPQPIIEEAFFGAADRSQAEQIYGEQRERCYTVRAEFAKRFGPTPPLAPECIIYAGGGNLLALAPAPLLAPLADAIEWLYTEQTLTANSAAVGRTFSLLELQYGLQPATFWREEFDTVRQDSATQSLLDGYYSYPEELRPPTTEGRFYSRKTFGELTTLLAMEFYRRRAGQGAETTHFSVDQRAYRTLPHFELPPFAIKCHSCDARPAVMAVQDPGDVAAGQSPKVFCQVCARKRVTGQKAKQEQPATAWFTDPFDWQPQGVMAWEQAFQQHLWQQAQVDGMPGSQLHSYYGRFALEFAQTLQRLNDNVQKQLGIQRLTTRERQALAEYATTASKSDAGLQRLLVEVEALQEREHTLLQPATTLSEIGAAAKPDGYIGLIYADGNNVGAQVARIATPAAYRQFAVRLEQANRAAVFTALARHLHPHFLTQAADPEQSKRHQFWVHPFEIVTIGGDDVLLFVPGDQALAVVKTMSETLEALLGRRLTAHEAAPPRYAFQRYQRHTFIDGWLEPSPEAATYMTTISASSGVVVAQEHTPVFFLVELVQELQKSAKKMRKRLSVKAPPPPDKETIKQRLLEDMLPEAQRQLAWDNKRRGGTVDFLILKAVDMITSNLEDFRSRAFERKQIDGQQNHETLYLTARPYTLLELQGLMKLAQTLAAVNFPASQQYTVGRNLAQGRLPATVNYLYFYSRLRDEAYRRALDQAFHYSWGVQSDQLLTAPWRQLPPAQQTAGPHDRTKEPVAARAVWETIWHDLLEIAEFVQSLEEKNDAASAD